MKEVDGEKQFRKGRFRIYYISFLILEEVGNKAWYNNIFFSLFYQNFLNINFPDLVETKKNIATYPKI